MAPGVKQSARYVNPYRPETLIGFALRRAIDAHPDGSLRGFGRALPNKIDSPGGLNSKIDNADRAFVELVTSTVNRKVHPDMQFRLTALYDAVATNRAGDEADRFHTEGELPSHYFTELANAGSARSKPEALVRGMAARAFLLTEPQHLNQSAYGGSPSLDSLNGTLIDHVLEGMVRDLVIVAGAPPNGGGMEATRLLAEAGTLSLKVVGEHLRAGSPLSWRLLRVVTECIRRAGDWATQDLKTGAALRCEYRRSWQVYNDANRLLKALHESNPPCLYRARSLWEEAVSQLPKSGSEYDWINEALRDRALHGETGKAGVETPLPVRERVTAAWAYFWRIARNANWAPSKLQHPTLHLSEEDQTLLRDFAHRLTLPDDEFRKAWTGGAEGIEPNEEGTLGAEVLAPSPRDRGLRYAGEFLLRILDGGSFWIALPDNERHRAGDPPPSPVNRETTLVVKALEDTDLARIPENFRDPFKALVAQSLLTIDGVSRRECLTTLLYVRFDGEAAAVFEKVIRRASQEDPIEFRWLVEIATFGLGWMARRSDVDNLLDIAASDMDESVRMTALMALADMPDEIRGQRELEGRLRDTLIHIIEKVDDDVFATAPRGSEATRYKVLLRSALYALAMLRNAGEPTG
jgi:hypothetical protein